MNYVFHPKEGSKVVSDSEYHKYLENGWFDSPAKFPAAQQSIHVHANHTTELKNETNDSAQKVIEEILIEAVTSESERITKDIEDTLAPLYPDTEEGKKEEAVVAKAVSNKAAAKEQRPKSKTKGKPKGK